VTVDHIEIGARELTIEDVLAIAERRSTAALTKDASIRDRWQRGADFIDRLLAEDGVIYGVTTGYGDSVTRPVPPELVPQLPLHLTRFHGCGTGRYLDAVQTRAVIAARLVSLARGYSGVSIDLLEQLTALLQEDVLPQIPEEGSVGASGDLTPLSYVAAALIGERQVVHAGRVCSAADALAAIGRTPLQLRPKEGLALMNGTAVMTALACLAFSRAEYLARVSARITSLCSLALGGNAFHFTKELFDAKPHPGQAQIAWWIRSDLEHEDMPRNSSRLQDRYSLRCAPHVIGVLGDTLPFLRKLIETELNSANDNPLVDPDTETLMHGGHFYGGHIAFAMDSLKVLIANLADLIDRQLAMMVDTKFSNGLPSNLSGASAERAMINHGFKAVQIASSAWAAEALKGTMPASVFSRSTECHNQDKVSMGTIAARDCLRVLELTEQVAAAGLLAGTQGLELRLRAEELSATQLLPTVLKMREEVFAEFEFLAEDRPLEADLRLFADRIRERRWSLYEDV
jgi:histidine ammonia-lyase